MSTYQSSCSICTFLRKRAVDLLVLLPLALFSCPCSGVAATRDVNLSLGADQHTLQQVNAVLEVKGQLKLNSEGTQVIDVPVQIDARVAYAEQWLQMGPSLRWAGKTVRAYDQAEATITYQSKAPVKSTLRSDRRILATTATKATDVAIFSPLGPLTRDELDLVNMLGNTAILDDLLPGRDVRVGDKWKLACSVLAPLLGLDTTTTAQIQCELNRVEKELAIVHMTGSVSGAVNGIASDMKIAAKYAFDVRKKQVTWFAMALHENRSIGHAQPGLNVDVRVRIAITPLQATPMLQSSVLTDLDLEATPAALLLELNAPEAGFRLLTERRWHAMIDQSDVVVMRLIEQGELVAQCNLSPLPILGPGQKFGMVQFQTDIRRVLGDSFGEVTAASESNSEDGIHVLRVVVTGTVSELPIQWIYYHLSNSQGQRASCVFTLESALAEPFGGADQALIGSFQFVKPAGNATKTAQRSSDTSKTALETGTSR